MLYSVYTDCTVRVFVQLCMFYSGCVVTFCCSVYCLCVNVYCAAASG